MVRWKCPPSFKQPKQHAGTRTYESLALRVYASLAPMTMLLDLPVELLHCVAAALPGPSLCVLASACKAFRSTELRWREELWRAVTLAQWPGRATRLECGVMARVGVSWKAR